MSQPDIANLTHEQTGNYLTLMWGGMMMVGRFLGSAIMQRVPAETVLATFAVGAFVVAAEEIAARPHRPHAPGVADLRSNANAIMRTGNHWLQGDLA